MFKDYTVVEEVIDMPLNKLCQNPNNARSEKDYDVNDPSMFSLIEDVKKNGIITPMVVIKKGKVYEVIAGNRRLVAAKANKLSTVPVLIREIETEEDKVLLQMSENVIRKFPDPIERGRAYANLIDNHGITIENLRRKTGDTNVQACVRAYRNFVDAEKKVGKERASKTISDFSKRSDYSKTAKVVFKRNQIDSVNKIDLLEAASKVNASASAVEAVAQTLCNRKEKVSYNQITTMLQEANKVKEFQVLLVCEDYAFFKKEWEVNKKGGKTDAATFRHYFIELMQELRQQRNGRR
jgi:ParB/RepB/Spo0J family partition protein